MSTDLRAPLRVGSMFAGIGGIDLGLERTGGFETAWFAEIDEYASAVLRKHWPDVPNYGDVRNIDGDAERVDLIAAGFPCQPVSLAGKGLAQEDPRWLWPEVARVVGLLRPSYVLLENVPGLRKRGLSIVIGDLAALGYDAEWQIVSAASVGAPHLRERFVIVAYPSSTERRSEECESLASSAGRAAELGERIGSLSRARNVADSDSAGLAHSEGRRGSPKSTRRQVFDSDNAGRWKNKWALEPDVDRVVHGISAGLDRIRGLGNSVVPQVFEEVGRLILANHLGVEECDASCVA